ncbi:MAG: hypothetical protein IJH48_08445 [Oscillospiraceae bacterium]|nr:hypothetical protein [Oscillospiraceae bacterium]
MKKTILPLLLAAALLLSGCGSKSESLFRAFSEDLRERRDLAVTAQVRAEYDDRSCSFTLRCAEDADGCTVEVLEPELIRGVKARMSADGTQLVYDSVSVDTGDDGGTGLSPMGALPLLLRALRGGALDSVWKEDGNCAVRLIPEDGIGVTVLFDADMCPEHAEIDRGGKTVLFLEITDFG